MLTVTEAAGARLAHKLAHRKAGKGIALRFVWDEDRGGWSVRSDNARPSDVTFSHEGRTVLVLDEHSSHLLRNRLLDVQETDAGPRLQLRGR